MNTLTENLKLKNEMAISDHSVADIMELTGLGNKTVSRARKGSHISIDSAIKISSVYNKEPEDMFDLLTHKGRKLDLLKPDDLLFVRAVVKKK